MEIKNQMKLEFISASQNVALARVTVASFASQLDYTLSEIEEIKVSVSEAVSNAIVHGYKDRAGIITLIGTIYPDRLEIIIQDEGRGIIDIEKAKEPAFTTEPDRMGLGLSFIESFMDELEIQSEEGKGTKLRMIKLAPNLREQTN
jgi:stage II sporulation protein AB (anti-sigma F factor)